MIDLQLFLSTCKDLAGDCLGERSHFKRRPPTESKWGVEVPDAWMSSVDARTRLDTALNLHLPQKNSMKTAVFCGSFHSHALNDPLGNSFLAAGRARCCHPHASSGTWRLAGHLGHSHKHPKDLRSPPLWP